MLRRLTRQVLPPVVSRTGQRVVARLTTPQRFAEDKELARLRSLPSGEVGITNLFGMPFTVPDGRSFAHLYEVYFRHQLYRFKAPTDSPYIIDCGANIGVTVVWWKTQFPNSRVVAFEADPSIFSILKRNCGHFKNTELINAAVADRDGKLPFIEKGGEGGHLSELASEACGAETMVPSVRLWPFLQEKCDFLKMDIEGAEPETW